MRGARQLRSVPKSPGPRQTSTRAQSPYAGPSDESVMATTVPDDAGQLPTYLDRVAARSEDVLDRQMLKGVKERERRRQLGLEPRMNPMLRSFNSGDDDVESADKLLQQLEKGSKKDITVSIPRTNEVKVYRRQRTDTKAAQRSMTHVAVDPELLASSAARSKELKAAAAAQAAGAAHQHLKGEDDAGVDEHSSDAHVTVAGLPLPTNFVRRTCDVGKTLSMSDQDYRGGFGKDTWSLWITERQAVQVVDPNAGRRQRRRVRHHRLACRYHTFSTHRAFRQLSLQTTFPVGAMRESNDRLRHAEHGGGANGESRLDFNVEDFFVPMTIGWWDDAAGGDAPTAAEQPAALGPAAAAGQARDPANDATATTNLPSAGVDEADNGAMPDGDQADGQPTMVEEDAHDMDAASHADDESATASRSRRSSRTATATAPTSVRTSRRGSRRLSHASGLRTPTAASVAPTGAEAGSVSSQPLADSTATPSSKTGPAKAASSPAAVFLTEHMGEPRHAQSRPMSSMSLRCKTPDMSMYAPRPRPHSVAGEYHDCSCTDRSTDDELEVVNDRHAEDDVSAAAGERLECWRRGFAKSKVLSRSRLESRLHERRDERQALFDDRQHFASLTREAEAQGNAWRINRETRSATPSEASMWHRHFRNMAEDTERLRAARDAYVAICDASAGIRFPSTAEDEVVAEEVRQRLMRNRPLTPSFVLDLMDRHASTMLARKVSVRFLDILRQHANVPTNEFLQALQGHVATITKAAKAANGADAFAVRRVIAHEVEALTKKLQKLLGIGVAA